MSKTLNRFNRIARHYDLLTRIVFGKSVAASRTYFLQAVPPRANLLILGGGTGEILAFFQRENPSCQIWYIDESSQMLALASGRISGEFKNAVYFIHGTEEAIPAGLLFDAVITNYFLDLFPDHRVVAICEKIYRCLGKEGAWFVSDFVNSGKWWQKTLLWIMYRFFVSTCKIEATRLPSWEVQLQLAGMKEDRFKLFFGGFIRSAVYYRAPGIDVQV